MIRLHDVTYIVAWKPMMHSKLCSPKLKRTLDALSLKFYSVNLTMSPLMIKQVALDNFSLFVPNLYRLYSTAKAQSRTLESFH